MSVKIEKARILAKDRIVLTGAFVSKLHETVPGARFSPAAPGPKGHTARWTMPLSMDACIALRERFGPLLEIGPDLWLWAKQEKASRAHMVTLSGARDAVLKNVPDLAPALAEAMANRTYQRVGARFVADGGNVLIGDQPGMGKTLEALAGILEAGIAGPHLIVCPKTAVQSVWAREIPRWVPGARVVTVPDGKAWRDEILGKLAYDWDRAPAELANTWVVVNPEMCRAKGWWDCPECGEATLAKAGKKALSCGHDGKKAKTRHEKTFPQLFTQMWGAIVADESDRQLLRATGKLTQTRLGMELIRDEGSRSDGLRLAMSGTPFRGRPHLLWGTLNWLQPDVYPAMWSWIETYWEVDKEGYGGSYTVGSLRADREQRLWDSLSPILLRRTKEECAADMPPKTYVGTPVGIDRDGKPGMVGVWLPMLLAQEKLYRSMFESSVAILEGGELSAVGVLAEITRLKQFATSGGRMEERSTWKPCKAERPPCVDLPPHKHEEKAMHFVPQLPSNKFEYLVDKLHEWGFPDEPQTRVIVASQFTQTLEMFAAELAKSTPTRKAIASVQLTGAVTGGRRDAAIQAFNTPGVGPDLMFLNTKAGGVAITIDTADIMVVLDETWVPDDQEQLEDRIHRVSNPRQVEYHYLRSTGTVEEAIALVNMERERDSKRLLDGRRGLEYATKVLKRAEGL